MQFLDADQVCRMLPVSLNDGNGLQPIQGRR
jgi:hypothetical protein